MLKFPIREMKKKAREREMGRVHIGGEVRLGMSLSLFLWAHITYFSSLFLIEEKSRILIILYMCCFALKVHYATFYAPVNKEADLSIQEIVVCRS